MKRRTNFGMLKPVRTARPNNLSTSTPWLADDAVDCEPVSVPNSLLTGKNTGKFTKLCPGRQSFWSRCARLSGTSVRLALESEQGIYKGGTGKIRFEIRESFSALPSSLYVRFFGAKRTLFLLSDDFAF